MYIVVGISMLLMFILYFEYKHIDKIYRTITLCCMVTIVSFGLILNFRIALVNGNSMLGTYKDGDAVVVSDFGRDFIKRGDIIVFYNPSSRSCLIKRVIGLSGDNVKITDNKLYVNDKEIKEDYIYEPMVYSDIDVDVPDNKLFVLGDNRNSSLDSRSDKVGLVNTDYVIGSVIFRVNTISTIVILTLLLIILNALYNSSVANSRSVIYEEIY